MGRLATALRVLWDRPFFERVRKLDAPAVEAKPVLVSADATQVLALFQREGRFVDFLQEEIGGFSDAQIGAAARSVHAGCKKVLKEYFELAPVYPDTEGSQVKVPAGFDPSAIRLTGEVSGDPPFAGTLQHHGWKATRTSLPTTPAGQDRTIIAPAEVELA